MLFDIRRARRRQSGGFTIIELMVTVAIVGVLAAAAVPSFMRYIRKAKTAEARGELEKIYNSARIYYLEQHGAKAISGLPKQFPNSYGPTPVASCCATGLGKCSPESSQWEVPTWVALHFSVDDTHFYRYQFESSGFNADAQFTARALGDLDCDGEESTFEMFGRASDSGTDPSGSAAVYKEKELE